MSLDKAGLIAQLKSIFEDIPDPPTPPPTAESKATAIADAIDEYVKTAVATITIPAGTVIASAEIPIGAVSIGESPSVAPNVAPIPIDITKNATPITGLKGDPDAAPGSDTEGGLS